MKKTQFNWLWLNLLPTFNLWAAVGDVWLEPATTTIAINTAFNLQLLVDVNTNNLASYDITLNFNPNQVIIDTSYQNDINTCDQGVCPGLDALGDDFLNANVFTIDNDSGILQMVGFDSIGKDSNSRLHILTINFKSLANIGSTPITLTVNQLSNSVGDPIASINSLMTGSTINIAEEVVDFFLTINKIGTGTGRVYTNDSSINCGNLCSASLTGQITLHATPDNGSKFNGWSGALDCNDGIIIMDADKTCIATFNLDVPVVPTVTTNAASNITQTSATLNGSVLSNSATATTSFNFGSTIAYGTNIASTPSQVYSSSAVAVSANKTGLVCNKTYHYRVTAANNAGTGYGADKTFTTSACIYTVTPTAGSGGTVNPSTAQMVANGLTKSFTVTPNTGYTTNSTVGGTCPQGTWNSNINIWKTGAITANCSVSFSFTPIPINGVCGSANGGTFATIPTANLCSVGTANAVTGNGPWNWNCNGQNGGSNASCSANITAVNSWLYPTSFKTPRDKPFTLEVTAKSDGMQITNYEYIITFDPNKLALIYNTCNNGVCPGTNALTTNQVYLNSNNSLRIVGLGGATVPGNDLQLLIIHFRSRTTLGATTVNLQTNSLANVYGDSIGLGTRGATINVSTGICGDADGNTVVNIVDALAVARKVVGMPPPPTIEPLWADVNYDSRASIVDALHIARYSIGLVLPPEVCAIGKPL